MPTKTRRRGRPGATVPAVLTVAQVAGMLHRTPRTVRGLIAGGKLKATRFTPGGAWLIFAESVSALLGVRLPRQGPTAAERARLAAIVGGAWVAVEANTHPGASGGTAVLTLVGGLCLYIAARVGAWWYHG